MFTAVGVVRPPGKRRSAAGQARERERLARRVRQHTGAADGTPIGERLAATVRAVLIARLDSLVVDRLASVAADKYGLADDEFLRFWQDVQAGLFPEEFLGREPSPAEAGVVPRGGKLGRVKPDWFAAFADRLLAARDAGPLRR